MSTQTTGLVLLAVGATLLWSAWALVLAGVLLVVVPDVVALVQRRRRSARARADYLTAVARGDAPAVLTS